MPGRLEVFGKHTDYAGGRVLVTPVSRGITVSASRASDDRVLVTDTAAGESVSFAVSGEGPSDGWARYPQTVIRRLAANFPGADLSARIELSSDLPQAAGMSSSSALIVAIAESLIACAGIEASDAWRREIRSPEDRASYFGCVENGSAFGALAGDAGVGTHGGSEDHAAIVIGRAGMLHQFAFAPLRVERVVPMPAGWTFVIAGSGVEARKTGAAREAYNRLADSAARGQMTGARLEQFRAENARVAEAAEAFARGDIARIGELASASQRDAERLLGNQVPETIALVAAALERGAAAASSFGAGWGGSVWALVEERRAAAFAEQWGLSPFILAR